MKLNSFGRIGVLMGGPSSEKAISLKSGTAVAAALRNCGEEVVEIEITSEECIEQIKNANIDLAFIAMHGYFGEDGAIQQILEDLNIPYTGSGVKASRLAMDKIESRRVFELNKIPVPAWESAVRNQPYVPDMAKLGLPLVIKPACEGSSIGLSIVADINQVPHALELAFKYGERIVIEQYIKGKEITVGILKDKALPVIQVVPQNEFYDYQAKYTPGMTNYIIPAPLEKPIYEQAQKLAQAAHHCLGCRAFSRVDMLICDKTGEIFVLEVNTIPGLTQTSLLPKAAALIGSDFTQLCRQMILYSTENLCNRT